MHTFAKYLLGPLLLFQGWQVRRSIIKLPEPEGERSGDSTPDPAFSLLILGDSAAAGVGAAHQSEALSGQLQLCLQHNVHWRLLAKTGRTTRDTLDLLEHRPAEQYDVVLISLGVNDVTSEVSLSEYLAQTRRLIAKLKHKFGARQIIFSGLPPVAEFPALPNPLRWYLGRVSKQFDAALRGLVKSEGCDYLFLDQGDDIHLVAEDGFHPGPGVYARWAKAAAELMLCAQRSSDKAYQSASI